MNKKITYGKVHIPKHEFKSPFISYSIYKKLKKKYDLLSKEHDKLLSLATLDQLKLLKQQTKDK